ncbi:DUF6703 family protein [Kribbella sp. NBC_00482]|uniref:DUF6703 family protein n=1 Tax=Kribbella sp. NBC_00482 TaxID=2975968 RepID=UPI002E199D41
MPPQHLDRLPHPLREPGLRTLPHPKPDHDEHGLNHRTWNNGRMSTPSSPLRQRITKVSYPYVAKLHAAPKLTLPAITLFLALVGVFAPVPVGLPALVLLAMLLGWLAFLSWPAVTTGPRFLRIFSILVILLFGVSRLATG